MLEIAGTKVFLQRIITQLLNNYKFKNPQDSQKLLDYFADEIKIDDMLDKTIPIYKKYFTNEEIKQLIAFYETPVAQKLITVIPQISQESLTIVISSARAAAERALKKLEAEGYIRPSK